MKLEKRDPRSLMSPLASIGRSVSEAMDLGILPWAGGMVDQPSRALRLGRLWKMAYAACEHRASVRRG